MTSKLIRLFIVWTCITLIPVSISADTLFWGKFDLDTLAQDFVYEKKQIHIPGFSEPFNPSIVKWKDGYLLSFRTLVNANRPLHSQIGLVLLNSNFEVISEPQLLNTREKLPLHPSKSEDARLFSINDRIYIIYNDNEEYHDHGTRRMYYSELFFDGTTFTVQPECINDFPDEKWERWEKNWVPFDYDGTMLLAYSILPHKIFLPIFGMGKCEMLASTTSSFFWPWGNGRLYGGTPALKTEEGYLAFFHSSCKLMTQQTGDFVTWHYFMGAYLFDPHPPFAIKKISPQPIISRGLYDNPLLYKRVIYPGGYVMDNHNIWIVYGREDCECWVIRIDKQKLLESLVPVNEVEDHYK